jgi:YD repeat-containing protein
MATKYTYASPGVINVTDAAGNITELKFTSTGQIQGIKDSLSRVTNFTYDNKGNLKSPTTKLMVLLTHFSATPTII